MAHTAQVARLYRYPVKGLSAERLAAAEVAAGGTFPADRAFAIENGPTGFDPAAPRYFPKTRFLMLMRNARLAALTTRFSDDDQTLTVARDGVELARGCLATAVGRAAIEGFLAREFAAELRGPPTILDGRGHSFSDVAKKVVSIINLDTLPAIESAVGRALDPLRFRANVYVAGWPAWREYDLLGQTLTVGTARLKLVKRIVRCAATNVDPATAERDIDLPQALMQRFGHCDCGVYAEVAEGGVIRDGDSVSAD